MGKVRSQNGIKEQKSQAPCETHAFWDILYVHFDSDGYLALWSHSTWPSIEVRSRSYQIRSNFEVNFFLSRVTFRAKKCLDGSKYAISFGLRCAGLPTIARKKNVGIPSPLHTAINNPKMDSFNYLMWPLLVFSSTFLLFNLLQFLFQGRVL